MSGIFEGEDFNWFEPAHPTEEPVVEAPRPSRGERIGNIAALVGVCALIGGLSDWWITRGEQLSKPERLAALIEADQTDPRTLPAVEFLTGLTPDKIDSAVIRDRQALGKKIQDSSVIASLAGFRQGLDNKGQLVDMYDIATQLIPDKSQAELEKDGVKFTEVTPVSCDAPAPQGDHGYDPLDYSNHPPSDFKVTTEIVGKRQVTTVPLGSQQLPYATIDNFLRNQYMDRNTDPFSFIVPKPPKPCVDYPHKEYGPNRTTYPQSYLELKLY